MTCVPCINRRRQPFNAGRRDGKLRIVYLTNHKVDREDLAQLGDVGLLMEARGHEFDTVLLADTHATWFPTYREDHAVGPPADPTPLGEDDIETRLRHRNDMEAIPGQSAATSLGCLRRADRILVRDVAPNRLLRAVNGERIALSAPFTRQLETPNPNIDGLLTNGILAISEDASDLALRRLHIWPTAGMTHADRVLRHLQHNLFSGGSVRKLIPDMKSKSPELEMSVADVFIFADLASRGHDDRAKPFVLDLLAAEDVWFHRSHFSLRTSAYGMTAEGWGSELAMIAYAAFEREGLVPFEVLEAFNAALDLPLSEIGRLDVALKAFLERWNRMNKMVAIR